MKVKKIGRLVKARPKKIGRLISPEVYLKFGVKRGRKGKG